MFSAKHSFAEIKECNLKKQKCTTNWGCLPTCTKVFFWFVFCYLVCIFLFVFFVRKNAPQRLFSAVLAFLFSILFPPKACLQYPSFLPIQFFSLFSFCLPFGNSIIFLCFCSATPFWKRSFLGLLLSFIFVAFCFVNVCLFLQKSFPNIPFLKPCSFFSLLLFLFLFSWCMFLPFCFYVGFVFGMFSFVIVLFCFLFCFQTM